MIKGAVIHITKSLGTTHWRYPKGARGNKTSSADLYKYVGRILCSTHFLTGGSHHTTLGNIGAGASNVI